MTMKTFAELCDIELQKALDDIASANKKIKHSWMHICIDEDCPCCDLRTKLSLQQFEAAERTLTAFKKNN